MKKSAKSTNKSAKAKKEEDPIQDSATQKEPEVEEEKTPWCVLESKSETLKVYQDIFTFGRSASNNKVIPNTKISAKHCSLSREKDETGKWKYFIEDLSSNGTYHNGNKIGKKARAEINAGDEIALLRTDKESDDRNIAFIFKPNDGKSNGTKRPHSEKNSKSESIEEDKKESETKRAKFDEEYINEMKCGICIDIMYQAVTVMPCLHNFCGSCYSEWMRLSTQCPACRKEVNEVKKNPTLNNLIDKYLAKYPGERRTKEEYEEMDQNNKITSDVMPVSRLPKKARGQAPRARRVQQSAAPTTMTAREWIALTSRGGASAPVARPASDPANGAERCGQCRRPKITASRPVAVCALCRVRVCHSCKASKGIMPVEEHKADSIPETALNKNDQEKKILTNYLEETKSNLSNVFTQMLQEMETKKWTYRNGLNADVSLTRRDEICNECFATVWGDLLYRYRVSIQSSLPEAVRKRPNCWYGKECKTQMHNSQHAEKYNHICDKKPGK